MLSIENIYQFIGDEYGIKSDELSPDSDLNGDFGIEGDDFDDLILDYSNLFKVNLDTYLWYFHSSEEAVSPFAFIFPPPNQRVEKIAVTPELLLKYAQSKVWSVKYPTHTIPNKRWDIISLNIFLVASVIVALTLWIA